MFAPSEDFDDEMDGMEHISDADAQSILEVSISHVATRLRSAKTPAIEKAAAMEEVEGNSYFDSEEDETPPAIGEHEAQGILPELSTLAVELSEDVGESKTPTEGMSLGRLPSPRIGDPTSLISPWHAGPKTLQVRPDQPSQSSLAGVFDRTRARSLSGGAEALRKLLPKSLPSMTQVGSLFGSSGSGSKSKLSHSPNASNDSGSFPTVRSGNGSPPAVSRETSSPRTRTFEAVIPVRPQTQKIQATPVLSRPKAIRRSTSDDSLLYHSLSRASSLGDDSRFENQQVQVNSRAKAIRDSLQDRSSFRMPQLPSMPRVPSFSFNMNFLNNTNVPARWRYDTDSSPEILPDILPGNVTKKKTGMITNPAVASGMVGAAISRPDAAAETAKPAVDGPNSNYLTRAMENLEGDIVIMGGYRGSILRSTETNRQLWVPVKVGLNIRKVNLEVGWEPEDEEHMPETIYPSGMLQNIGPVDISKRLFKRLSNCENARNGKLRVWDYGYDWRLSPHLLSRQLTKFLEKLPSNQISGDSPADRPRGALVIAHSLGGLITRHVVNHRPELFFGVVYAGVPQACVNILGPLRNGDDVLFSSRVLTAQVNFSLRTSFVLLPEDGECFVDIKTKEKYPVDFFDVNDWIKYRWSPCTDPPLPPRNHASRPLTGLLSTTSLLSLPIPGRKAVSSNDHLSQSTESNGHATKTTRAADTLNGMAGGNDHTIAPQMGNNSNPVNRGQSTNSSVSTAVTIPREKAITYLTRTLAETKAFKHELHHNPLLSSSNRYPPLAFIYGKSTPTLYRARVDGREGISCSDSYDNLAFASGDGVCLAKEAMLPEGYMVVSGGRVSSDRGHLTLLGDLNAVGRAIQAVVRGRERGIGLGRTVKTGHEA